MNSSQAREAKLTNATSLWHPAQPVCSTLLIVDFQRCVEETYEENLSGFEQLHQWSVSQPDLFWPLVWSFCDLQGQQGDLAYVHDDDPIRALFFPQVQLNVLEAFLKGADGRNAITFMSEAGHSIRWTSAELKREVEMLAAALRAEGIGRGDHVVGYVPNMPQTVAAMLATASIGAVWSSCAPESGPDVVVDRFDQIAPKLMFAADGYFYGGKTFDTRGAIAEVAARLPSLQKVVVWPYAQSAGHLPDPMMAYDAFQHSDAPELRCEAMGFRDPLYVMFSSGTTGKPKCIEHSGGGTLLRMLSEHQLHCDLRPNDRMFDYRTCNWMMWNWQVAALASEATLNLGGNRIGTAEIYRQLDKFDAIRDAVVVGQIYENDVRVILFVLLQEGVRLDENLISKIKSAIRSNASPRHVPARIIAVSDIARTMSGKVAELAVRDTVNDHPVRNLSGIANPEALAQFKNLPELSD